MLSSRRRGDKAQPLPRRDVCSRRELRVETDAWNLEDRRAAARRSRGGRSRRLVRPLRTARPRGATRRGLPRASRFPLVRRGGVDSDAARRPSPSAGEDRVERAGADFRVRRRADPRGALHAMSLPGRKDVRAAPVRSAERSRGSPRWRAPAAQGRRSRDVREVAGGAAGRGAKRRRLEQAPLLRLARHRT